MTPIVAIIANGPHPALNTFAVHISGMTGDVCVYKVRHALMGVLGVHSANVIVGSAIIKYDPAATNEVQMRDAIRRAGYKPAEEPARG